MSFRFYISIFFILTTLQTVISFDSFAAQTSQRPLSVVFTGGSSLGAYQAGYFYQINQNLKKTNSNLEIKSLSGSSAGAINAFLAVYDTCLSGSKNAENSLSFNIWRQFTLANLYSSDKKQNTALLTKAHIDFLLEETKRLWSLGFPRDCELDLNLSATRLQSQIIQLNGLLLNRAEETFSLKIKGEGLGRPPKISNSTSSLHSRHTNFLNFKKNNFDHNFSVLANLVAASASFPYFFEPEIIEHCESKAYNIKTDNQKCHSQKNLQEDLFFDGAVFRNSPLIYILDNATHSRDEQSAELKHLIISSEPRSSSDYFNYSKSSDSFLSQFLLNYGTTSNDAALYERIKNSPSTEILKSQNLIPRIGEPFLGFFGFIDSTFLEFDFILGMLEADFINDKSLNSSSKNFEGLTRSSNSAVEKKECLKSIFINQKTSCENVTDQQFLKLAELSLGILISECTSLKAKFKTSQINPLCSRVSRIKLQKNSRPKKKESKLNYSFRQLNVKDYYFKDFPKHEIYQIPIEIRNQISIKTNEIDKNKNSPYSADIKNFERILLLTNYYPRKSQLNFLVGDALEITYIKNWNAFNFLKSNRLKFTLSFQADEFVGTSSQSQEPQLSTLAGYEYMISGNSLLEMNLGLRAGAKFNLENSEKSTEPIFQLSGSVSFYERVRFQTIWEFNSHTKSDIVYLLIGMEY